MSEKPQVDPDRLREWLSSHSEIGEVKDRGPKILINSPFAEDTKFHCGLFPLRGKGDAEGKGRFRDFKSGKSGNLFDFVMQVDGCEFGEAVKKIGISTSWRPERKLQNDAESNNGRLAKQVETVEDLHCDMLWPKGLVDLTEKSDDEEVVAAARYMKKRGIDPSKVELYYCTKDHRTGWPEKPFTQRLSGRVFIPYFGPNGYGIYWSARGVNKRHDPKYLEPHASDKPVQKEAILYCMNWKRIKNKNVMIVEGALDAISLELAGFPAVAVQGAQLYDIQARILKHFGVTPVFAYDRDKAGRAATLSAAKVYPTPGFFVFPPAKDDDPEDAKGHDWNSLLVQYGPEEVKRYVLSRVAPLTDAALFMIQRSMA